jgi:hypothetical protein
MSGRAQRVGAAVAVVPALVAALSGAAAVKHPPNVVVSTLACGMSQRLVARSYGGTWVYSRPNPFGAGHPNTYCIRANGTPGFKVTRAVHGGHTVKAYPFTGVGCAYNLCSRGTDLPRRVSRLAGTINTSWNWKGNAGGYWDASYDIWFDRTGQKAQQNNGAELMVWLRTPAGYRGGRLVTVAGRRFWFTWWKTSHKGKTWNYIQFRYPGTRHGVHALRLMPFIRYAENHGGLVRPRWFLTSVHAGYEIWTGGQGLQTTWFNAHT